MAFKSSLILSYLLGYMLTTTAAYAEYDDDAQKAQLNAATSADIAMTSDEIYDTALLQEQVEAIEKRYHDMDVDAKTEVSLKNVQNISDNQLFNEYTSIEDEAKDDNNTSIQRSKQNSKIFAERENETENPLIKKLRMRRIFTITSTTVPEYIRNNSNEKPNSMTKDINNSNSDYVEDEEISDHMPVEYTSKMSINKSMENSSEENDETVPLAMKYYDDILPEKPSSSLHMGEVSSEDYYEEQYNEDLHRKTTTASTSSQTSDNNILRSLFGSLATSTTATTTTSTQIPIIATTLPSNNGISEQFDPSLFTTSTSVPPKTQIQIQTVMSNIPTTSRIASAVASATSNDKKGKQIPIVSSVPIVTTTTTTTSTSSRRRLLPHEQLRNYIEDAYIRMPLAVIVDPSAESLEKTKALWNEAMRTNLNIKIVLVTLNESEESPAAFNFNNTRQFLTGLNSIKEQTSGDAFRGISHAAELVPYDSAVFISTAQLAKHTDQVQDSAITLLKKRIRLYLIWFGERSLSENETQDSVGGILGEVAIRSGGEILHIVGSENSQELEGSTLTIVADALRGSQEVDVPVDTTLSSLHVKIDKLMRRAVLETPNGV